jgi:glycosyltransferase involved in cell wall biosynthesis
VSENSGGAAAKKVALLCPAPGIPALAPGGASVHLRGLAGGFAQAGADVRLLVRRKSRGGGVPDVSLPGGVTLYEAPRGRLPGFLRKRRSWDEAVDSAAMERWVARLCRGWRPDLIYERWSLFSGLGRGLRKRLRAPWLLEVNAPLAWEACWFEGLAPSASLLLREEQTLQSADHVLVVSEALREYVLRRGVSEARVIVIPNGADRRKGNALREPAPREQPFVLGYEGTFKPWQGMVEAVAQLADFAAGLAPRPLRLELWGDGPQRQPFLEQIAKDLPQLEVGWRGWGDPVRSLWDAAWVPLGLWPPPSTHIAEVFGESPPGRYFSPLKEAAARAEGIPCWYGDNQGLVHAAGLPRSWGDIAGQVLDLAR